MTPTCQHARVDPSMRWDDLPTLREPPPWLVGHWTGGERGPSAIYRVLRGRGLSVHWTMSLDGDLVEHAPLTARCAHAGSVGNRGLGIEIASCGLPRKDGTSPRPFDVVEIHGRPVRAVRFTDAQLTRWVELAEWCAATYGWPRQVPDCLRQLTPREVARWRGVLEHLHLSRRKVDAGGHLTRALVRAGWKAVSP